MVLDGNVFSFSSRYFAMNTPIDSSAGKQIFKKISQELICDKNPDIYNQLTMEFGAYSMSSKKSIMFRLCFKFFV